MNFTSEYLSILKKIGRINGIYDQDGIPIKTISFANSITDWKRKKPKLKYDKYLSEEELSKPIIEKSKYQFLREEGMEIYPIHITKNKNFLRQAVKYEIGWKTNKRGIGFLPLKHKLFFDLANRRFQLRGINCRDDYGRVGYSNWFPQLIKNVSAVKIDETLPSGQKANENRIEYNKIDDIPIMLSVDGSIVCIPKENETKNVGFIGKKGSGKSLLLHRLVDELFWNGEKVAIMNDIQSECFEWNHEQKNWILQLKFLNENPLPLPIIYIYPHTNDLYLDYIQLKNKINFIEMTIPFDEAIERADVYLKLGGSFRYVLEIKEKLLNCETPDEIKKVLEESYPQKTMRGMVNKMIVSFNNVFDEGILNITNKQFPYKLRYKEKQQNPFVILMKQGLIPCFETANLSSRRYMPEVFSYHLDSIFKSKAKGELLHEDNVYVAFDEISQICDDKNQNSAHKSLCSIATRGRRFGMGILYASQNYSKIPRKIKSNTDYIFAFQHSNEEEVKKIRGDFNLNEIDWKGIINFSDFEVLGITNEHFVCYKGRKKWIEKEPIRGTLIPPLSQHLGK